MADSLITVPTNSKSFTDLYAVSGIPVGTSMILQNRGPEDLIIIKSATQPTPEDANTKGVAIPPNVMMTIPSGEVGIWGITSYANGRVNIQLVPEIAPVVNIQSVGTIGDGVTNDAWGKLKVSYDVSLFHGMFTTHVPEEYWKEEWDDVEQTAYTYATSVNGKLNLTSSVNNAEVIALRTLRNPRYQPNRGHLYASSMIFPNPTAAGHRDFGLFNPHSGVFFRLKADGLYAVRRTTVDFVTNDIEELIDLPFAVDLSKGNIFDIQMQWRGVGNIKFYIGNPATGTLKLVHTMKLLGTLTELSLYNPALSIAFACTNLGDQVTLECGCVDVSSEGGEKNGLFYGAIGIPNESGQVTVSGFNVPVLVVKSNKLDGGLTNTRDIKSLIASAYGDQRAFIRVWATRDETAITLNEQSWTPYRDGNLEYLVYDTPDVTTPMTFNTAKAELVFGSRVNADETFVTSALFEGATNIYQTPGDIFIFTMHRENGGILNCGVTYEFAEET